MNYDNCDGMTYTIKQGDTLYGISRKYDVPLAMILHANPYADVYRLNIGDTICIPVKNKKKCCNDKNSSSMNDKADRMENFRENQNVRVSENAGENSEMSFMEDMTDNMNLPDKVQDVSVEASDENMQRSVNADDDKWVKYVAQPGDTLFDVFEKSDCDIVEFLNKNCLKGIYILPGLVYFVKEK